MKISSASKKVLASALSAAMVVAFAPTAAFAAATATTGLVGGDKVTVNFHTGEGTVQNNVPEGIASQKDIVVEDVSDHWVIDLAATPIATNYKQGTALFSEWVVDQNGNGTIDADENLTVADGKNLNVENAWFKNKTTIDLIAKYAVAEVKSGDFAVNTANSTAVAASYTFKVTKLEDVKATGAVTKYYNAQLTDPKGTVIAKAQLAAVPGVTSETTAGVDIALTKDAELASSYKLDQAGDYTLTIVNAADGKTVVTKKYCAHTVTLDVNKGGTLTGKNASYVVTDAADLKTKTLNVPNVDTAAGAPAFQGWAYQGSLITNANGVVSNDTYFDKDVTLVAQYAVPQLTAATYAAAAADAGTITWTAANYETNTANVKNYTAVVNGPNGFSKTWTVPVNTASITMTFGGTSDGTATPEAAGYTTTAPVAAGEYTLSLTANLQDNAASVPAAIAPKSVSIAAVAIDLGEGKWTTAGTNALKTVALYYQVGEAVTYYDAIVNILKTAGNIELADSTQGVTGWTFNGKAPEAVTAADKKIAASGATFAVTYGVNKVAAPTYTQVANSDGTYSLTFTAAAGTKLSYDIKASTTYTGTLKALTGTIKLKPADVKAIKVVAEQDATTVTLGDSELELTYMGVTDIDTFADDVLANTTSQNSVLNPQTYADVLKTAKKDGEDALKALGYTTAKEYNAKLLSAKEAMLKAIAGVEIANLDALKAGTVAANGYKTVLPEVYYDKAIAAIEKVLKDFDLNNDYKANGTTLDNTTKSDVTYANNDAYVSAITKSAKDAATAAVTYAKADVDAAAAVTAQLKDPKTAAAGLEAYKSLSAAAKELVSTADLAAAEAAVAQAELVKAQDKAAAATGKAKVKGAVYSIKAKGSKTIKLAKSASGAKTTLVQKSGTKYAKVSGTTIKLKAAAKKGKTYTIKVKVKSGTYTTATTSFKVKVK